jgi:hypothetical protein
MEHLLIWTLIQANSSDNEFIELSINGDSIDYNVYRDDGTTNGFRESLRDSVAYDNGNYYPVFIFNGERAKAQADAIKFTPEPYGEQPTREPDYGLLGNSTPPPQPSSRYVGRPKLDIYE